MSTIYESIDVEAPADTAYACWQRVEDYPRFLEEVERVERLDAHTGRWVSHLAGRRLVWTARLEVRPGMWVSWRGLDGPVDVLVTFSERGRITRVTLWETIVPQGLRARLEAALGVPRRRARADLQRFKEHVEAAPGFSSSPAGSRARRSG